MTKRAWDILIMITGLALEMLILLKDKLTGGGNHDSNSSPGNTKTQ